MPEASPYLTSSDRIPAHLRGIAGYLARRGLTWLVWSSGRAWYARIDTPDGPYRGGGMTVRDALESAERAAYAGGES
jgi:hypothetical protein